jgi:hypothetical protein
MTAIHLRLGLALALLAAGLAVAPDAPAAPGSDDPIRATLEQAQAAGTRSVTVNVQGSTIALLVTAVEAEHVIGRSAQHERIVVRIDRIDSVAF